MKKCIVFIWTCFLIFSLVACKNRDMNYIIENEPSIMGIVKDSDDNAILIENEDGQYWVSLQVERKDSMTHFNAGDEVVVYFDGVIEETYPMQINKVYAITLKTPADRTENSRD